MESQIEAAEQKVASDVLSEAVHELTGASNRKWAVILVALVLGSVVTALAMRARSRGGS